MIVFIKIKKHKKDISWNDILIYIGVSLDIQYEENMEGYIPPDKIEIVIRDETWEEVFVIDKPKPGEFKQFHVDGKVLYYNHEPLMAVR